MEKRGIVFLLAMFFFATTFASALCEIDVSLLNQDPYPAVPGEKMEAVFTISNIDSAECGTIEFEVINEYPFTVSPGFDNRYIFQSGTFTKDYNSQKIIPIDYIVDNRALDGDTPIEVKYRHSVSSGSSNFLSKTFDIKIEDVKVDFEIFVSDYDFSTKEIKFEILNIGKADIEAVTIEVPKQEGIKVYGSNRENVGDLSSNEDTSSDLRMDINTNKVKLLVSYSDSIQVRRVVEKEITFDASLFEETKETGGKNYTNWIVAAVVIALILYFFMRRKKKKK